MNKKVVPILIIIMIIVYPFIMMPVAEISLREIYKKAFDNVDDDFILKFIRTTLYLYYWIEKIILIFLRPLIMTLVVWGGARYISLDYSVKFSVLFSFLFSCELILLLNDYFNIGFNYFQLYTDKTLTLNLSPLNLYYYLGNKHESKFLIYIFESISAFSLLYFILIFRFTKTHYRINSSTSYLFTFNLLVIYIIMAMVHPGSMLIGVT